MARTKKSNPDPSRRTLRVLMVEDNPVDAELITATLKRAGYPLFSDLVDLPDPLRERLDQSDYDIILSDHNLRTWTGIEALEIVQQKGKDIPFVVVTATLGDEAAVEYIKQGAADYVLKNRLERLPAVVTRTLRAKAHQEEAARLQEQILYAKKEWELTFDTVPDAVLLLDEEQRVKRANRANLEALGLREFLQVIGKPCHEVLYGMGAPPSDCPHCRMLETGQEEHGDIEFADRGKIFYATCTPIRDSSGVLCGSVLVMRDITEKKRAERALKESEARYRELFENANDFVHTLDLAGNFTSINKAGELLTGYTREEILEKNVIEVTAPEYRELAREALSRVIGGETMSPTEIEGVAKDGHRMWIEVTARPVYQEGKIVGVQGIARDVTERKQLEKQLRQLQKFEAIGQLAGGIAHDFNNALGAIMGWTQMGLEETAAESRAHSHFQRIARQCERAASLTKQLLAFARRQILEPRNLDLNQLVEEALSLTGKLIGEHIEVKSVLASDLCIIRADPAQLEQVLMNLFLNARDAMANGGLLLVETQNANLDEEFCRTHLWARPGRFLRLSVSDNGIGMDAATLEHIFEPFFTTKEVGKGTGLGLATVYGIVRQHGGFVHVYSEPGKGTMFKIYLPVSTGMAEESKRAENEAVRGGTETILVAEDHEGLREVAQMTLGGLGYQVLLASDGEQAVQMFERHHTDIALVLLDVMMPKLSGPDAYAKMCALKPGLPGIFVTGYSSELEHLRSITDKGMPLLQKPYSPNVLSTKVREVLDRAKKG